jgi:hypothetical protein
VGDEDRRDALVAQPPHDAEERGDLVVRQRARRLVEDQNTRVDGERTGYLDELLLIGPEPPDRRRRVDVEAEPAERGGRAAPRGAPVDERPATCKAAPEEDVFCDGEIRHQRRLLRYGGDAGAQCVGRTAERDTLAGHGDCAAVGQDLAREDLQQRGLPRAVLAHEGVDLRRQNCQVRATQGVHAAVVLVDAVGDEKLRRVVLIGHRRRGRPADLGRRSQRRPTPTRVT